MLIFEDESFSLSTIPRGNDVSLPCRIISGQGSGRELFEFAVGVVDRALIILIDRLYFIKHKLRR